MLGLPFVVFSVANCITLRTGCFISRSCPALSGKIRQFFCRRQRHQCRDPQANIQPSGMCYKKGSATSTTVRSGAEERRFWAARLDVLTFRLRSYHVLISYSAECSGQKFYKTLMFLGQAGTFLSFQARRSSAKRSSTYDLTVFELSISLCTRTVNRFHGRIPWQRFSKIIRTLANGNGLLSGFLSRNRKPPLTVRVTGRGYREKF